MGGKKSENFPVGLRQNCLNFIATAPNLRHIRLPSDATVGFDWKAANVLVMTLADRSTL